MTPVLTVGGCVKGKRHCWLDGSGVCLGCGASKYQATLMRGAATMGVSVPGDALTPKMLLDEWVRTGGRPTEPAGGWTVPRIVAAMRHIDPAALAKAIYIVQSGPMSGEASGYEQDQAVDIIAEYRHLTDGR